MKKVFIALSLALSLSACANVQNAWNTLTTAKVSPQAVYIAGNSFVAAELTAKNYLHLCRTAWTVVCKKEAIVQIIPAVRSARVSDDNLRGFMKTHPDALGAQGLYDALITTTNTLKDVETQYGVGK